MTPRLSPGVHSDLARVWTRSRSSGWEKSMRFLSSSLTTRYPSSVVSVQRLLPDHPKRSSSASSPTTISYKTGTHPPAPKPTAGSDSLRIHPSQLYQVGHQTRHRKGVPAKGPNRTSKSVVSLSASQTAESTARPSSSSLPQKSQPQSRHKHSSHSSTNRTDAPSKTRLSSSQVLTPSRPLKPPFSRRPSPPPSALPSPPPSPSLPPSPSPPPLSRPSSVDTAVSNLLGAAQFQSLNHSDRSILSPSSTDTHRSSVSSHSGAPESTSSPRSSYVTFPSGSPPIEFQLLRPLPELKEEDRNESSLKQRPLSKTSRRPFESTPLEREASKNEKIDHQKDPERQSELAKLRREWKSSQLDVSSSLDDLPSVEGSVEVAHLGLYIQALRDQQTDLLHRYNQNRELVLRALEEMPNSSMEDGSHQDLSTESSQNQTTPLAPEPIRKLWLAKNEKDVRAVIESLRTTYQSGRIPILPTFYEDLSVACKRLGLYHLLGEVVISSDDYGLKPPPTKYLLSIRGFLKHLIDQEISILSSASPPVSAVTEPSQSDTSPTSPSHESPSKQPSFRLTIPLLDRLFIQLPFDPVLCALSLQALSILSSTSPSASLRFVSLQESLLTSDVPSSWAFRTGKNTWWSGLSPGEIKRDSYWLLEALDSIRSFIPPELASLWKSGIPSPGLDLHRARLREVFLLVDQAKPEPYAVTLDQVDGGIHRDTKDEDDADVDGRARDRPSFREDILTVRGLPEALPLVPRLIESFLDSPLASHHSDPIIVLFSLGIRMKLIPDESALREIHWTLENLPKLARSWDKVFAATSPQKEKEGGVGWISRRDKAVSEACLRMAEELLDEKVGLWRNGLSLGKTEERDTIS